MAPCGTRSVGKAAAQFRRSAGATERTTAIPTERPRSGWADLGMISAPRGDYTPGQECGGHYASSSRRLGRRHETGRRGSGPLPAFRSSRTQRSAACAPGGRRPAPPPKAVGTRQPPPEPSTRQRRLDHFPHGKPMDGRDALDRQEQSTAPPFRRRQPPGSTAPALRKLLLSRHQDRVGISPGIAQRLSRHQ